MGDRYLTKKGDSNSQRIYLQPQYVTAQAESRNSEEMDRPFKIDNNICKSYDLVQLNQYDAAPYFLQLGENLTLNCLLIYLNFQVLKIYKYY